uniref:C2H2-type domain-containing protein n=1 Tax=Aquila chrysaetos chrysaetos TaxID=223781 RepID=A0A663EGX4_AQUCH
MGKKPLGCCDCGKGFDGNSDLTQHQLVHTREKPYLCAPCGKSWGQNSSLTHVVPVSPAGQVFAPAPEAKIPTPLLGVLQGIRGTTPSTTENNLTMLQCGGVTVVGDRRASHCDKHAASTGQGCGPYLSQFTI